LIVYRSFKSLFFVEHFKPYERFRTNRLIERFELFALTI
jgi:hypothetical protein